MASYKFLLFTFFVVIGSTSYSLQTQKQVDRARAGNSSASVQSPNCTQHAENRIQPTNLHSSDQDPCKDAITQKDLNDCAAKDFRKSDVELNQVYSRIISTLREREQSNLQEAQKAWIKYRDTNCEAEAGYHGGSIAPMLQLYCLKRNTEGRIKELKQIYEKEDN